VREEPGLIRLAENIREEGGVSGSKGQRVARIHGRSLGWERCEERYKALGEGESLLQGTKKGVEKMVGV